MYRRGIEYHGNCPYCSDPEGEDRFVVFADGNAHCRKCQNWWNAYKFRKEFFMDSSSLSSIRIPLAFSNEQPKSVRIVQTTNFNSLWSDQAEKLVNRATEDLVIGSWGMQELARRGIHPDVTSMPNGAAAGVGYIQRDVRVSGASWGLSKEFIWIPQGILIPTYGTIGSEVYCLKLKVRRQRVDDELPKYIEISGSSNMCMILGYNHLKTALVVESELDAILCIQEAQEFVWCVALGGASKPIDKETDFLLRASPLILWALDQDEAGRMRYFAWRDRYPQLKAWPADKAKAPGDMSRTRISSWIERGVRKYVTSAPTR